MKKLFYFALFAFPFLFSPVLTAQSTVTIQCDQLTPEQRSNLCHDQNNENTVATSVENHNWSGIGHEIGTAINESLGSINAQANSFAGTKVGKWTILLIIYKVAGRTLINYTIGGVLMFTGFFVWIWMFYRNCVTRRILIEETKEHGKRWEVVNDSSAPYKGDVSPLTLSRLFHTGALLGLFLLCSVMMFGCQ